MIYVLWRSRDVRDGVTLLATCARIAIVYLLIASPLFYPWYTILPIALLALAPSRAFVGLILVMTVVARVLAPVGHLRPAYEPITDAASVATFVSVAAILVVFLLVSRGWIWRDETPDASTEDELEPGRGEKGGVLEHDGAQDERAEQASIAYQGDPRSA